MQITKVNMQYLRVISGFLLLLTASAIPEIPSKGKHNRNQDMQQTNVEEPDMPRFAEAIANVTVSVGRDALLACVVENLKGYKVAWVRVDTQTILSIHHNVISQNNRISLTYNDHRSWYLHIKEVEENDRGWYMCQVNTDPMRSRKGYLQVVVPPVIVEGITSNDLVVREGLNVTLMCKARGYPDPYVMWRREDGEEMLIGGENVNVVDGEMLHITKVSRLHMAAYLCVASNGVPPSISKRVHLRVQFPPMLSIPNQLEGAYVGQDVVLECHTEAYPASINYWTTERGDMIISDTSRAGDKYETTSTVSGYTKYMKLKIRSVGSNDFGTYRCVAKNSLGETDGNIKLDEMPAPTTTLAFDASLNRSSGNFPSSMFNSNGFGRNSNSIGGREDNNQASIRNPPGAFHNSGSALAQHNLLVYIVKQIKIQSIGIWKCLSICFQRNSNNNNNEDDVANAKLLESNMQNEFCWRNQYNWLWWKLTTTRATTTIDNNHKMLKIFNEQRQLSKSKDVQNIRNEKTKKKKRMTSQWQMKMSRKIKTLIELCGLIGNWHWHLLVTVSQIFMRKTIPTTITTITITSMMRNSEEVASGCIISYSTDAAACVHDNRFNGNSNVQLDRMNNNNNNNNNKKNLLYKFYRNSCYKATRQLNYNGHAFDYNCGGGNRRRQQIIICIQNDNKNYTNNKNISNIITNDNDSRYADVSCCCNILLPLATFSPYFILSILLLLLLLLLFEVTLHLNIGPMFCSPSLLTHFVLWAEKCRRYLKESHNNDFCCKSLKINRSRLSFNSQHYLYDILVQQQQQQTYRDQNEPELCIGKITTATTTTNTNSIMFSAAEALS